MGFQRVPFDNLVSNVNKAIDLYISHSKVTSVDEVSRKFEVELLLKTIEVLTPQNKKHKATPHQELLLNAMVYYVRLSIERLYTSTSPTNSVLYVNLGHALGLTERKKGIVEGNQPTLEDTRHMLRNLANFMLEKTYNSGNPDKGYLSIDAQDFLAVPDFKAHQYITTLLDTVHKLDKDALKNCHEKSKEYEPKAPTFSLLSSLFSSAKTADHEVPAYRF